VVFGELWGADPDRREIDLQVIATALHLQRPFRIPGDQGHDALAGFYYDPDEWAALFPPAVLDWMRRNARPATDPRVFAAPTTSALAREERGAQLLPLPPARALPVLVAVRMSIAFPGLLSAVPLYTVDGKRGLRISPAQPDGRPAEAWFIAEKVYLADGGITSNCPIQLFDAPLPRRPTFAMRLGQVEPDRPRQHRVWLHGQRKPAPARVQPVGRGGALNVVLSFVTRIVMTAVSWRDQVQSELPGYRERVVTVDLKPDEGGLNLQMPATSIRRLARFGRVAALRLHAAYGSRSSAQRTNAWDEHRWIRIRSTLAAAQSYLRDMQRMEAHERAALRALFTQMPALEPRLPDADALAHAQALFEGLPALEPSSDPANLGPAPDFATPDLSGNQPEPAPRLRMSSPW
jgi:Patatin-like phospholipase